jgi:hypothetical protein
MRLQVAHSNTDLTPGVSLPFPDLQADIAERLGSDDSSGPACCGPEHASGMRRSSRMHPQFPQ